MKILALTGAGISAASGIPTFRGAGGLYQGVEAARLASPEGFAEDPELVWDWYRMRIGLVRAAAPNAGHLALSEWARRTESFTLITSNVDDLHERAGSPGVHHLHGRILEARCTETGRIFPAPPADSSGLPRTEDGRLLRPNVVWFGERPWAGAFDAFASAEPDLALEIGVSGAVGYGFTEALIRAGVPVIRINPDASPIDRACARLIREPAEEALPRLLEELT